MNAATGFVLFLFAAVAIVVISGRRSVKRSDALETLALHLGLHFQALTLGVPEESIGKRKSATSAARTSRSGLGRLLLSLPMLQSWNIEGSLNGVHVRIFPASTGSKKGDRTGLNARFRTPLDFGLAISPESVLDRIAKTAGMKDLKTGNDAFDRRVVIQARSEAVALPILRTPAVQQALFEAFESNELTRVDDEGVHAILQGVRTDPQDIRPLLDILIRAAMAVDDARLDDLSSVRKRVDPY